MKTTRKRRHYKMRLELRSYGNYLDDVYLLEAVLARNPASLQIEIVGSGELPSDTALLIRAILRDRSPQIRVITHARSSLQDAAVLVWLLGDTRLIRDDARLFFRSAGLFVADTEEPLAWHETRQLEDDDLEEMDYVRVLQAINEYLPVKELAGRPIELPELREFGLVDNKGVDHFLAAAFRKSRPSEDRREMKARKPVAKPDAS